MKQEKKLSDVFSDSLVNLVFREPCRKYKHAGSSYSSMEYVGVVVK